MEETPIRILIADDNRRFSEVLQKSLDSVEGFEVVGAVYNGAEGAFRHGVYDVPVADTTAAGDTFTGYFLASISRGEPPCEALREASMASSLAVSRKGAVPSIPWRQEILEAALTLSE